MWQFILGSTGFILYFIYDINSVRMKNAVLQKFFAVGSILVVVSLIAELYAAWGSCHRKIGTMTGLLNRKYFYEVLNEELEKNREASLALAIINVDDFKLYNQLYGVKEGDLCLQRIADIIRSSVGESGYTARYGGKEFAVLLPGYDLFSARNMVESIAKQIYVMNNRRTDMKLKAVTVSAGISAAPYAARNVKELMENVDLAVYHVKHNGKNGIQVFDMMFRNNSEGNNTRNHTHIYQEYESTIYALTAAIDAKDHVQPFQQRSLLCNVTGDDPWNERRYDRDYPAGSTSA